jgi:hypothetical protein
MQRRYEDIVQASGMGWDDRDWLSRPAVETIIKRAKIRPKLVRQYAWAIPSEEVLDAIKALGKPIVEMGAGTGYWTWRLRQKGVACTPFDRRGAANDRYALRRWVKVKRGSPLTLRQAKWKHHALLLSWPPYDELMADEAIRLFRGDTLIYIGEGFGGCTGDDAFHRRLEAEWDEVGCYRIPQWDGIHDRVYIYTRKADARPGRRTHYAFTHRQRRYQSRMEMRKFMAELEEGRKIA